MTRWEPLVRALERGWIAGAVLDVFPEEPLPPDNPLWDLPGVTMTPYMRALGFPKEIADIFAGNLKRCLAGEPLL
ncbi:MAG: NAD(P)-dependent oxidoreductase [Dehalococcoidia bacterium]